MFQGLGPGLYVQARAAARNPGQRNFISRGQGYLGLQAAHHYQQLPVAAGAQVIWMGLRFPSGRGEHQAGWDRETLPILWGM